MASITKKVNKQGITKYYSDVNINKRRVRCYLGLSLATAKLELKKLEYELLFSKEPTKDVHSKLKPATLSFLSSLESSGVSTLHLKSIQGKTQAFLTFCESSSLFNIADITPDMVAEAFPSVEQHLKLNEPKMDIRGTDLRGTLYDNVSKLSTSSSSL